MAKTSKIVAANRTNVLPARVFADSEQLERMTRDRSLQQLVNVTTLPGIIEAAFGMPDMHEGYGFPVGGVLGDPHHVLGAHA